jgi:hypothetical protein
MNLSQLAGRQTQEDIFAFLRHDLGVGSSGPAHLATPAGLHLDIMHPGTQGYCSKMHAVPRLDVCRVIRDNSSTDLKPIGRQDVALLAINEVNQSNP